MTIRKTHKTGQLDAQDKFKSRNSPPKGTRWLIVHRRIEQDHSVDAMERNAESLRVEGESKQREGYCQEYAAKHFFFARSL
jgi:hypothetical protein